MKTNLLPENKKFSRLNGMLTVLFAHLSFLCPAQFSDNFSDGNFTVNPQWDGHTTNFIVNNENQLQLHASLEGNSTLMTYSSTTENTQWDFWIKLKFSPSANNFARVYLCSDDADKTNCVYLQFGEQGTTDAIELFRKQGTQVFSVCRSIDGLISMSFEARIRVRYTSTGEWQIFGDLYGGSNFKMLASASGAGCAAPQYFMVECNYTSSNTGNFYFDDFSVGHIVKDTIPPGIISCKAISNTSTEIIFNEVVTRESAENPLNYFLHPLNIFPAAVNFDEIYADRVVLYFEIPMQNGENYQLDISAISDQEGNFMNVTPLHYTWYKALPYSIVINEILADPVPRIAMPEYEFIELANNTPFEVNLCNWMLLIGETEKIFEDIALPPYSYLIVSHEDATEELGILGHFYGFPSFSLSNSGEEIQLFDDEMNLISGIAYNDTWYNNDNKSEGGYSMEQIDQFNPCCGGINWIASESPTGGTPGETNSVFEIRNILPKVERIEYIDSNTFCIVFTQAMEIGSVLNQQAYKTDHESLFPESMELQNTNPTSVTLHFNELLNPGTIYTLSIVDTLFNCSHLPLIAGLHYSLGIPEKPDSNDVVINEVLFHPLEFGEEYVEIINRSEKIIDISGIYLAIVKNSFPDPADTSLTRISTSSILLFPAEYLLLTNNIAAVKNQYYTPCPEVFFELDKLPDLKNDQGTIMISDDHKTIDMMNYSEEMHYPLLQYFDGVSLERVNPDNSSLTKENWHSASEASGFGTPGYQNSQFVDQQNIVKNINVIPEVFSPDGDGYNDMVNFHYKFEEPGTNVSINIFDSRGVLIRNLIDNHLCGTNGFFSWDGLNNHREKATIGIYIALIKTFTTRGNTETFREVLVLGGYL